MNVKPLLVTVFTGILLNTLPASAEVYRSTDANGNVTYSDKQPVNAVQEETIKLPAGPSPEEIAASKAREQEIQQAAESADSSVEQRMNVRAELKTSLEQSKTSLQAAEEALANGQEPLPGERLGKVGGGTRLSDAYWNRIHKLELDVEQAQRQVGQSEENWRRQSPR